MNKKILIPILIIFGLLILGVFLYYQIWNEQKKQTVPLTSETEESIEPNQLENTEEKPQDESKIVLPTDGFLDRITKKPFGIFVAPGNSPVQPERFSGYHTAADAEYGDLPGIEIPVKAISDGTIVYKNRVSGYGGVIIIRQHINNKDFLVLYGHLNSADSPAVNSAVLKGQKIGILGEGGSFETDRERKHLHLGILATDRIDLRGYVQNQNELTRWIDPIPFLKERM